MVAQNQICSCLRLCTVLSPIFQTLNNKALFLLLFHDSMGGGGGGGITV